MGYFNLDPNDPCMQNFLNRNVFANLIKTNTYFKGAGSYIDLILIVNVSFSTQDHVK